LHGAILHTPVCKFANMKQRGTSTRYDAQTAGEFGWRNFMFLLVTNHNKVFTDKDRDKDLHSGAAHGIKQDSEI
jgi:hypothetical protein